MKIKNNEMKTKRTLAITQMVLMISMSFAVAFLLSEEVGVASAAETVIVSPTDPAYKIIESDPSTYHAFVDSASKTIILPKEDYDQASFGSLVNPQFDKKLELVSPPQTPSATNAPASTFNGGNIFSFAQTGLSLYGTGKNLVGGDGQKTSTVAKIDVNDLQKQTDTYTLSQDKKYYEDAYGKRYDASTGNYIGSKYDSSAAAKNGGILGTIGNIFSGKLGGANAWYGPLVAGLAWGGVAAAVVQLFGSSAGLSDSAKTALTYAVLGGSVAGGAIASFVKGSGATTWGVVGGIGVGAIIFVLMYKKEKVKVLKYECLPWEPPLGGAKCEECNKDPFRPCSEYRCKSLGQACQLLNPGSSKEMCAWVGKNDVKSPEITPDPTKLAPKSINLKYAPITKRPSALGTRIIKDANSCLPPFTALEFGFNTNEPAQCKIDVIHTDTYKEMSSYVGADNLYTYNHTEKLRLPAPAGAEANETGTSGTIIKNDGTMSLLIRCQDANGNVNQDEYAVEFCVDKSPDTTPPVIENSSILSGSFVSYKIDSVPIQLYVNEPAQCKWSTQNKEYKDMENTMNCPGLISSINSNLYYVCSGNLTGVKDRAENRYYFRCKDDAENTNTQSYEFLLKGSQPLNIVDVKPNGTISGATGTVNVDLEIETANGAEEGKAQCLFTNSQSGTYVAMFETDNYKHKQTLALTSGTYNYYFRCVDSGGNAATNRTSFTVKVDKQAPLVTRAYKQEGLKIVTDENAECGYSLTNCNFNFNDSIRMIYSNPSIKTSHFAEWKPNSVYYIKCRDFYDNQPGPSECSLQASAVQLSGTNTIKI